MKYLLTSIIIAALSLNLHSQNYSPEELRDTKSDSGQPGYITENYLPGEKHLAKDMWPNYWGDIDPGLAPEGDYLAQSVFSPDGSKIYLTNRFTDMLTVFEWSTMEVVANIPTGDYPSCVAATGDYILAGCQFSDHVYVYSALDYLLIDSIPTGGQPCRLHVSPDQGYAFAACDIDDVCTVIDLSTMSVSNTINDFPVYLQTMSWSTQSARNWAKYSDFLVSPDGNYLVTHNGQNQVLAFEIATGDIAYSGDVESPRAIAFSGDSSSVVCASNPFNEAKVRSFAWPGLDLEVSVDITGYGLGTNEIVTDMDGSRAYIGTTNNTSTLVRLYSGDFLTFSNTYTAFWLGVTHDHQYAIGGQNRFSVIDFVNEQVVDQYIGLNQSWGTVSPVGYHVFSYDPLLFEGAYFFDISNPAGIDYRGSRLSGDEPEGDAPYRVAINSDYSYIISVNNLSHSVSIIDFPSGELQASIYLGEACYDVVTFGNYAVCGGYNNGTVKVIDLVSLELVAGVQAGERPMELTANEHESIVYAANIKSNTISVIHIDGANSQVLATIPCGVIGVYIPFFGIRSGVELDPTGDYLLVAASFDDQVKVIDTETNQVVKSLNVGDFPLAIAFGNDLACVTNLFDNSFSLISLDGAGSEVIGTWPSQGDYPVDVEYDPVSDEFWICNYYSENVTRFDANDGTFNGQLNMSLYGGAWSLEFYNMNDPVFLTVGNGTYGPAVVFQDSVFELPAGGSHLELGPMYFGAYAVVPVPGPDYVSVIELDWLEGTGEETNEKAGQILIYPNPFGDRLQVSSKEVIERFRLTDMSGRVVLSGDVGTQNFSINTPQLDSGHYMLKLLLPGGNIFYHLLLKAGSQ